MGQQQIPGMVLIRIDTIRPTEEFSATRAGRLASEIDMTGVWTTPLLLDRESMALMDGHHRLEAVRQLGLALVPAVLLSYEDDFVQIKSWRPGESYSREDIRTIARTGNILPQKTTRHIFDIPLPTCKVPLDQLRDLTRDGNSVAPATAHPSRIQMLSSYYHSFGQRLPIRTLSASALDVKTPETVVPHKQMLLELMHDPCMAALIAAAPCRIALGRREDGPFRLINPELLLLSPVLMAAPQALAMVARWGIEAAFICGGHPIDHTRFSALIRYGAALLRALPPDQRDHILAILPEGIAAELLGNAQESKSLLLLEWITGLVGVKFTQNLETPQRMLDLDLPIERVLVSNGDSRLVVDQTTGKNKYGTTPRPRPEAVHFSSSTASSISDYGFLYCDILRRDLLAHIHETGMSAQSVHALLSNAVIGELADLAEISEDEMDGALAPSGTDTELLAVTLARAAAPDERLVNLLISPEETGRGVKLAGKGLYFDELSATGAPIRKGAEVWPGASIDVISLPLRNADGNPLDMATMDAAFLAAGRRALSEGARVLAHGLIGSKTGLSAPSVAAIEALVREAPDRVDVVVDACQMRLDFGDISRMIRRGWMVQVSGSKALTGPPFAGALLIPTTMRDRRMSVAKLLKAGVGYAEDWSSHWSQELPATEGHIAFGAAFRWLPALMEVQLWRQVSPALRDHILARFSSEVATRLRQSTCFHILLDGSGELAESGGSRDFTRESIVAFEVLATDWKGETSPLGPIACRELFEMLNRDVSSLLPGLSLGDLALLRQEFHIGQPVELGVEGNMRTVLRIVLGFRFFSIVGLAGPGSIAAALESEISDLMRAINKLEILARNWWRLNV